MLTITTLAAAHRWDGPGAGFGWLFLLIPLFWIGVVALIVTLVARRARRQGWGPGARFAEWEAAKGSRSAEATLGERFAQGDIDEVEYRARLEVLRANRIEHPPTR